MHSSTILDFIGHWKQTKPNKPAIITDDEVITYNELYQKMINCESLPIPLLGDAWDSDFVLYTIGTTGKSKGVIISQEAMLANTENLIKGQLFSHELIFIIAGSMKHLGCWSKIFPTLQQGATLLILKDGIKDIEAFFRALDLSLSQYGLPDTTKFATFLVPANIRIILQFSGDRLQNYCKKIDFIETGAAPMPHADMVKLCQLLPDTRLYNTYASTETGICATYNYNDGRCLPGCLGKPLHNSQIFITAEGKIACKGKTLMSKYENAEELTLSVLHDDTLFTNDNGVIDEEGMLHILGRDDDIINVGGYKLAPTEVENIVMSLEYIDDCICISHPHPILATAPELLLVIKEGHSLNKKDIAHYIDAHVDEKYKIPLFYTQVEKIERNNNGKLNRKFYNYK